jgi:hypothetical protein
MVQMSDLRPNLGWPTIGRVGKIKAPELEDYPEFAEARRHRMAGRPAVSNFEPPDIEFTASFAGAPSGQAGSARSDGERDRRDVADRRPRIVGFDGFPVEPTCVARIRPPASSAAPLRCR